MKQRIETLLAGGVLALALFGLAGAGPLEDGQAAYQKGDYATALQIFRLLAEQRNASAQTALGVMYEHGQGVPQDFVQAVIWYNEAAYQGDPDAQGNLGAMYANGWGVPQDYAQAVVWYRQAGERGNAGAQRNLGLMYEHGQGVPQDYVSAHMWLNLAAASRTTDPAARDQALRNAICWRQDDARPDRRGAACGARVGVEAEVIVARAERPHDASIDAIDQLRVQRISTPPNSRVKTLI